MCSDKNLTEVDFLKYEQELWYQFVNNMFLKGPLWVQITYMGILTIIFIVALIGNLLACVVIYNDRKMHTVTNFYLFNMAISDFIVTFGIPIEMYTSLTETYTFGNIACKVHYFLVIGLWNHSILVITALSIERYIAIWHPLRLKSKPAWKRVLKVMILIWMIAIFESGIEVYTVGLLETRNSSMCITVPTPFARTTNGILALVTFVIPLGIMFFVYIMIAFKVNVMEKSNSKRKIFNHKDNRRKVNKLIVVLTLSFIICWLPFFVLRALIFSFSISQLVQLDQFWTISTKLIWINSWFSIVLNPILFSLMSTKFRKALKVLWITKIKRHQNFEVKL